jgi:pimeloyl-ACP methyl ester carboxylesterase
VAGFCISLTQPDPIPCREWLPRNRTGPAWLRRSNRPVGVAAYSLQNAVDDLVGILDAFDIDAADIVGHDWGAAVAWLTATAHPNRVHKLVVLVLGLALAPRPKATLAQSRYEALANALFNWGRPLQGRYHSLRDELPRAVAKRLLSAHPELSLLMLPANIASVNPECKRIIRRGKFVPSSADSPRRNRIVRLSISAPTAPLHPRSNCEIDNQPPNKPADSIYPLRHPWSVRQSLDVVL